MKKIVRKITVVMIAFALCGGTFISNVKASEIQPRGLVCMCGGEFYARTSYTEWGRTGTQQKCSHGKPWGTDMQLKRIRIVRNQCNGCGLATQNSYNEYTWECHGYR